MSVVPITGLLRVAPAWERAEDESGYWYCGDVAIRQYGDIVRVADRTDPGGHGLEIWRGLIPPSAEALYGEIAKRFSDWGFPEPPRAGLEEFFAALEHVPLPRYLNADGSSAPVEVPETPEPTCATDLTEKLQPLDQEFWRGVPEAQYYAQDLLAAGALTVLAGYIGAGKTPTVLRLTRALLAGEGFLGFDFCGVPEGFRVAYLTQEGEATFIPAAAEAGLNEAALSSRFDVGYLHAYATDDFEEVVEATARKLAGGGGGLLIVDTLIDWTQARDENDSAVMTAALRPLVVAVQKYGVAALASVHTVKDVDGVSDADADVRHVRGSGAVVSNASLIYLLKKARPRQEGGVRCLKRVRTRLATSSPDTRYTIMESGELRRVEVIEQGLRQTGSDEERVVAELVERQGRSEERDLRRALHLKSGDLDLALSSLESVGRIQRHGEGKPGDPKRVELA